MTTPAAVRRRALLERLPLPGTPLLLDGAMGTELLRRGVPTPLPLWSAPANLEQPGVVESIHTDYVAAGCELITTNTFRTSRYALERSDHLESWATWNRQAVGLARRAALVALADVIRAHLPNTVRVLGKENARKAGKERSLSRASAV